MHTKMLQCTIRTLEVAIVVLVGWITISAIELVIGAFAEFPLS
jgi:hypothetical protein